MWPTPGVSSQRNRGPTACDDPNFDDANEQYWGFEGDTKIFNGEYFGIGWGNFNKQLPLNGQFVRHIKSITDNSGTTHNSLVESPGSWKIGYTIGRWGIQFGLLRGDQCIYYPLQKSNFNTADWTRPVGCIAFYNVLGNQIGDCQTGVILPDTGALGLDVNYAKPYPGGFPINTSTGRLNTGATMKYHLGYENAPTFGDPARSLSFDVVANQAPPDPAHGITYGIIRSNSVNAQWADYGSFSNTGRRFFDLYDMCWDPIRGWVGFRPKVMGPWPGT